MNTDSGPLRAGREEKETERRPSITQRPAERQILVGQFQKNTAQTIRAHIVPWLSSKYIDIRVYDAEHPTTIGLRLDSDLIPQLVELLEKTRQYIHGEPDVRS
jgi:hypothetical protein